DSIFLSFVYTESGDGYQISIRTCHKHLPANQIAAYVCKGIGSGGGHGKKAGGRIDKKRLQERYGDTSVFDVIEKLLRCSIDEVCPGFCIS
ncbi:MAG: hypothetical protein Q4B50_05890, partial [Bacillota bacterium]|nr:hypothetical protein [Bacillota bacterium]